MEFFECNGFHFFEVEAKETNPFADAERAGDGGGYFQPCGHGYAVTPRGELVEWSYGDESCGDFGERYYIQYRFMGEAEAHSFSLGNMDNSYPRDWEYEEYCRKRMRKELEELERIHHIDLVCFTEAVRALVSALAYGPPPEEISIDPERRPLLVKWLY